MNKISIKVADMSCSHCVKAITEAVKAIYADAEVACDLETKLVNIQSKATLESGALVEAIEACGFDTPLVV